MASQIYMYAGGGLEYFQDDFLVLCFADSRRLVSSLRHGAWYIEIFLIFFLLCLQILGVHTFHSLAAILNATCGKVANVGRVCFEIRH